MRRPSQTLLLIAGLGVLTAANVAYQFHDKKGVNPITQFEVGSTLPSLTLASLTDTSAAAARAPLPQGCRVIILFSPTCTHCHTAARRDAATPDSLRLPTLWVSHSNDSSAAAFAAVLPTSGESIRYGGPTAFQQMKIHGVPAAFVASADNTVKWVGGYVGGAENHQILRNYC